MHMVVKLLSPCVLPGFPENDIKSHLTCFMPLLRALLFGLHTFEKLHILALYGMVSAALVWNLFSPVLFSSLPLACFFFFCL